MQLEDQEEYLSLEDLKKKQQAVELEQMHLDLDRLKAYKKLQDLEEWTLLVKDWLLRKPDLERKLSEALYSQNKQAEEEYKQELFAVYQFENYLRSIEHFGEMALDALKENNYE